ncbi:MAG: DUF3105 domain-containing protein [Candidatus Taylorbacteria bacterium]|nr:DUF3105 domain-containing protein [Candidatus Taylorbacteria bacterium]
MKKALWSIVVIAVLGFSGWGIARMVQSSGPQSPDFSTAYPAQSRDHIEVGTEHPAYNSNPPSGGQHYILTAKKQFYTEPIPDENAIHNLEHGDIWITYHPRVSESVKNELKQFAFAKILISPREANDNDIALVAWDRVDAFNLDGDSVPKERIMDFINRYRNKGPEKIPAGAMETTFN